MKKNELFYGLTAGLIVTIMMVVTTLLCYNNPGFKSSMLLGYATMLLAFSLIFFGIKNYKDKNGGWISFGKAFKVGLYITLIASTMYVFVWLVEYYFFIPDFMEKYTAHVIKEAKAESATSAELMNKTKEMSWYSDKYKNPLWVVLLTYMEIIPVGLLVSLISALILKKPKRDNQL